MSRVRYLPLLALVVTLTTIAAPAHAAATRKKAMWGPSTMPDGTSAFPIYKDLGVGIYQTSLAWDRVAPVRPANPRNPLDPAYHWPSELDRAIGEGARFGIEISLLVTHSPSWANGGRPARWAPRRPADFAAFLEAASKRYPGVRYWMIWGEPTKSEAFQPLSPDGGRRLRGVGLRAPRLYARMLDASYAALKRVSRRDL